MHSFVSSPVRPARVDPDERRARTGALLQAAAEATAKATHAHAAQHSQAQTAAHIQAQAAAKNGNQTNVKNDPQQSYAAVPSMAVDPASSPSDSHSHPHPHVGRALSVAWPDLNPDSISPAHADRRADLLAQVTLTAHPTLPTTLTAPAQQQHEQKQITNHVRQPLKPVLPLPQSSASSVGGSSTSSPSLSASSAVSQLHSSTSALLSTFHQSSSGTATPAKAKLNQFILDLVKNQIRITDDFSAMCRAKLREKDALLHSLQLQLHQLSMEKDTLSSEYVLVKNELAQVKRQREEIRAENIRLTQVAAQQIHGGSSSSSSSSSGGSDTAAAALKSSYESQLDQALQAQQASYEKILGQMKDYIMKQELEMTRVEDEIAQVRSERDSARNQMREAVTGFEEKERRLNERVRDAENKQQQAKAAADLVLSAGGSSSNSGSSCGVRLIWILLCSLLLTCAICFGLGLRLENSTLGPLIGLSPSVIPLVDSHSRGQFDLAKCPTRECTEIDCRPFYPPFDATQCPPIPPVEPFDLERMCPKLDPNRDCPPCALPPCPPCPDPIECQPEPCPTCPTTHCETGDQTSELALAFRSTLASGSTDVESSDVAPLTLEMVLAAWNSTRASYLQAQAQVNQLTDKDAEQLAARHLAESESKVLQSQVDELTTQLTDLMAKYDELLTAKDHALAEATDAAKVVESVPDDAARTSGVDAHSSTPAAAPVVDDSELISTRAQLDAALAELAETKAAHTAAVDQIAELTANAPSPSDSVVDGSSSSVVDSADFASIAASVDDLRVRTTQLTSDLAASQAELDELSEEKSQLMSTIEGWRNASKEWEEAQATFEEEVKQLKAELEVAHAKEATPTPTAVPTPLVDEAAAASTASRAGDLSDLEAAFANLSSTHAQTVSEFETARYMLVDAQLLNEQLIKQADALKAEKESLINEKESLVDQKNALTEEQSSLATQIESLQAQLTAATESNSSRMSDDELASLQRELDDLRARDASNVDLIPVLQSEIDSLTARAKEADELFQDELVTLKQTATSAQAKVNETNAQIELLKNEINQLKQQIAENEAAADERVNSTAQSEIDDRVEKATRATTEELESLRGTVAKLKSQLSDRASFTVASGAMPNESNATATANRKVASIADLLLSLPPFTSSSVWLDDSSPSIASTLVTSSLDSMGILDQDIIYELPPDEEPTNEIQGECFNVPPAYFNFEQMLNRECARFVHSTSDQPKHVKAIFDAWNEVMHPTAVIVEVDSAPSSPATPVIVDDAAQQELKSLRASNKMMMDEIEVMLADKMNATNKAMAEISLCNKQVDRIEVELEDSKAALALAQAASESAAASASSAASTAALVDATPATPPPPCPTAAELDDTVALLAEKVAELTEVKKRVAALDAQVNEALAARKSNPASTDDDDADADEVRHRLAYLEGAATELKQQLSSLSAVADSLPSTGRAAVGARVDTAVPKSVAELLEFAAEVWDALLSFDLLRLQYMSALQRITTILIYVFVDVIIFQLFLAQRRWLIALVLLVWLGLTVAAAFTQVWIGCVLCATNTVLALLMLIKPDAGLYAVSVSIGANKEDKQPSKPNHNNNDIMPPMQPMQMQVAPNMPPRPTTPKNMPVPQPAQASQAIAPPMPPPQSRAMPPMPIQPTPPSPPSNLSSSAPAMPTMPTPPKVALTPLMPSMPSMPVAQFHPPPPPPSVTPPPVNGNGNGHSPNKSVDTLDDAHPLSSTTQPNQPYQLPTSFANDINPPFLPPMSPEVNQTQQSPSVYQLPSPSFAAPAVDPRVSPSAVGVVDNLSPSSGGASLHRVDGYTPIVTPVVQPNQYESTFEQYTQANAKQETQDKHTDNTPRHAEEQQYEQQPMQQQQQEQQDHQQQQHVDPYHQQPAYFDHQNGVVDQSAQFFDPPAHDSAPADEYPSDSSAVQDASFVATDSEAAVDGAHAEANSDANHAQTPIDQQYQQEYYQQQYADQQHQQHTMNEYSPDQQYNFSSASESFPQPPVATEPPSESGYISAPPSATESGQFSSFSNQFDFPSVDPTLSAQSSLSSGLGDVSEPDYSMPSSLEPTPSNRQQQQHEQEQQQYPHQPHQFDSHVPPTSTPPPQPEQSVAPSASPVSPPPAAYPPTPQQPAQPTRNQFEHDYDSPPQATPVETLSERKKRLRKGGGFAAAAAAAAQSTMPSYSDFTPFPSAAPNSSPSSFPPMPMPVSGGSVGLPPKPSYPMPPVASMGSPLPMPTPATAQQPIESAMDGTMMPPPRPQGFGGYGAVAAMPLAGRFPMPAPYGGEDN